VRLHRQSIDLILGLAVFKQRHSRQATKSCSDGDLPGDGQILAFDLIVGATIWTELIVRWCKIARSISLKGPSRRLVAELGA
jgi:hypothetical protein